MINMLKKEMYNQVKLPRLYCDNMIVYKRDQNNFTASSKDNVLTILLAVA